VELIIKNSDLLPVLQKCGKALEKKTTIPILSSFLLMTEDNRLNVAATDLGVAVTSSAACQTMKAGRVCLPGEKFREIVAALPFEEHTSMSVTKAAATIKCGKSRFRLAGTDVLGFPEIPEAPKTIAIIEAPIFRRSVERTKFAISEEESRFTLRAMLLEHLEEDEVLIFAATDGHRLTYQQHILKDAKAFKILIPLAGLQIVSGVLTSMDHIELSFSDNHIWLSQGRDTMVLQRITGNFPDCTRILPKDAPNIVTVKTEDLKNSIIRSLICAGKASEKESPPPVTLKFEAGDLSLFAADSINANEAEESVTIQYSGPPVSAHFSGTYITECLNVIGTSEVQVRFSNDASAFEFRSSPEDGYRYIVMPRRKG
jgi:DNA polymerase-3 subunit beta